MLLDEMYPPLLAELLRAEGIEASTARELGLAGAPDGDLFEAARAGGYVLVTENVSDFARISTDRLSAGRHHRGVLIALSSRFSRRPGGLPKITAAVRETSTQVSEDRAVYL